MRTPVQRVRGKAAPQTMADILADELSKRYTVSRNKTLEHDGKSFVADIVLPNEKVVVEIQEKQDNKAIMAEMSRERIARGLGWSVCRFQEKEIQGDIDSVLYKVDREIRRH